jgi:hypothetical protein
MSGPSGARFRRPGPAGGILLVPCSSSRRHADAEFPHGRGQLGGPDLVQVAATGPQGRRGAVRQAQHGGRRAASGEGRQGGTEPEALVIGVRAHREDRRTPGSEPMALT